MLLDDHNLHYMRYAAWELVKATTDTRRRILYINFYERHGKMIQSEGTFSLSTNFHFINTLKSDSFDFQKSPNLKEAKKIFEYSDSKQGIIDYSFLEWALENNISYSSIWWFVVDICGKTDLPTKSVINTLFNKYIMYFDESNNCVKFRFKSSGGTTNTNWFDDFVLAGIVYSGETFPIDISALFNSFNIQKSALDDPKLKHIANYNGENKDRLLDILKSKNVTTLLKTLYDSKDVYIHWSTQNLLFYSLADIIDSISTDACYNIYLKNMLYEAAVSNQDIMRILAMFDYPNIKGEAINDFCTALQEWFKVARASDNIEEYKNWNYLISKVMNIKTKKELSLITDNEDCLMIENFVSLYSLRIQIFANSELYFDECGIVQDNIDRFNDVLCTAKKPRYKFCNSKNNKLISLSDMITGLTGALMAYINTHNINRIKKDISKLNPIQKENLRLFFKLRIKSSSYNMHFEHGSIIGSTIYKFEFITNELGIDKRFIKH